MLAWHFMKEDRCLRFHDGRKAIKGKWLTYHGVGKITSCRRGMHASVRILDAAEYAPGPIIARVELAGNIVKDDDKICAEHRKVLWWMNGKKVFLRFMLACAVDLIPKNDIPKEVIEYVRTGRESSRLCALKRVDYMDKYIDIDILYNIVHKFDMEGVTNMAWSATHAGNWNRVNRRMTSMVMAEAKRLKLLTK